jgi:hypothetical protein
MPRPGAEISQGFVKAHDNGLFEGTEDALLDQGVVSLTFSGTYSVSSTGRTLMTFEAPENFHFVAYPVSANRFIAARGVSGEFPAQC